MPRTTISLKKRRKILVECTIEKKKHENLKQTIQERGRKTKDKIIVDYMAQHSSLFYRVCNNFYFFFAYTEHTTHEAETEKKFTMFILYIKVCERRKNGLLSAANV